MGNVYIHRNSNNIILNPDQTDFEVVERKFRGHPDSIADMVAQSFTQKYIHHAWKTFPELSNQYFPNFSADKVVLSGASGKFAGGKYVMTKPIDALLIGKITQRIGDVTIDVDKIFEASLEEILSRCLGHDNYKNHLVRKTYSASLAGTDHDKGFYDPFSVDNLLDILKTETHANDTVFVVAYSPLSVSEKLTIYLDNLTASDVFRNKYPEIGSDIKVMIRRRASNFEITMCLPVFPEKVSDSLVYEQIIKSAKDFLLEKIEEFILSNAKFFGSSVVKLHINTKDTADKKYYAIWGTSLSKGDIGAVGRGNRQQGFISGLRPSTNEAMSGKNPNHFAGIIYQLVAEQISQQIYVETGSRNAVFITANNGDALASPNSIDIVLEQSERDIEVVNNISEKTLNSIPELRSNFINSDPYSRFMKSNI